MSAISKVKEQGILDNNGFYYVEEQGYYIVKGIDLETMKNVLNEISNDLKLDLTVE